MKEFSTFNIQSLKEILEEMNNRPWYKKIWYFLIYRIPAIICDIPYEIKKFWQRGRHGYADVDVWSLDSYLNSIIFNGVIKLRDNLHGHPQELTLNKWKRILEKIIWTFETAINIKNGKYIYMEPDKRSESYYIKCKKMAKNLNKDLEENSHYVMTFAECEKYEEGWQLFQKWFFHLWD